MAGCSICKHQGKGEHEFPCCDCVHNAREHFEPYTNADRIRSMSDEELADENLYFISEHALKEGFHYTGLDGGYYKTAKEAVKANLQWLKSEVKE